ncbi:MAG: hypothetical protein RLZZ247_593 [Cyanobacteriota bacterium]|jgi:hypothetical protein
MKLTSRYEQTSCRLVLEGLPDLSAGQSSQTIGILTGFSLALAGKTELEGQRDHLQALLNVVLPYARGLISGVSRPQGAEDVPVAIRPVDGQHELELRSSQPNTPPLRLPLDDAELSDLVRPWPAAWRLPSPASPRCWWLVCSPRCCPHRSRHRAHRQR